MEETDRKRRLELHGFIKRSPRFGFFPRFRQRTGEMRVGQEPGVGKLAGLPAMCDGFIVAAKKA